MKKFPGFPKEPATNYWPYPKALNGWWHLLKGSEQKALDYILRHTWGFNKTSDKIAYRQFIDGVKNCDKGCGIKSSATLSKALNGLARKGFITIKGGQKTGKLNIYSLAFGRVEPLQKLKRGSLETKEVTSLETKHTIKDKTIKDITINNIYTHFCKRFNKNPNAYKLTTKRISKIKTRLKEFSLNQILKAIDNASEDDFYSGKNDRNWVADLDYITRSYEVIEKLVHLIPRRKINQPYAVNKGKYDDIVER